ncbi:hypothetical protein BX600DRAFT_549443 [Xylariales sp. PMI_506]|nr:hypothetical protein BX600DRAFT_549443 [Xylariales sp. PMI_506]
MASAVAKTPSPPPRVRTPQTPKYGTFGDNWEPYSPPRKSARIANRTPSPQFATSTASSSGPSTSARKPSAKKSNLSTPSGSPQKRRAPAMDSIRRASGTLTAESAASAAEFLGIGSSSAASSSAVSHQKAGMPPTPAKTPRKQSSDKLDAGVRGVARNLFPNESTTEDISSPRKRKPKKYNGVGLDSFRAEEVEEDIEIYTDSRDRLPEVDNSAENPFYGETSLEPSTRRSVRKKKVIIPGEGKVTVDDAVQRDDGIVYVFRGKTFWKPRSDPNPADELDVDGHDQASSEERSGSPARRTTRSSIKPRLLFPVPQSGQVAPSHTTDDEEAATDIEDHVMLNGEIEETIQTPTEEKIAPGTPSAPRYAPASPPTTVRTTRVSKKLPSDNSAAKRPTKSRSPFDSWRRSKSSQANPHGQKREAPEALPSDGSTKRQRA